MFSCSGVAQPLVSVIVRTCNRPNILKVALDSILKQTYLNIEVIVVEDGINESEEMLRKAYGELRIKYLCTKKKMGRSKAGNLALANASGKYFNFLDDDDVLYPNHIEELVRVLEVCNNRAAYGIAEESQIIIKSQNPYIIREKRKLVRYAQPFNRILLYHSNYIPIQSILFERELYDRLGGFDEKLDLLEDWDLWVRYSTMTDYTYVEKVTSMYHVPYVRKSKMSRDINLNSAKKAIQQKFGQYNLQVNVGQIHCDMDYIVKKYKTGRWQRSMRLIVDFLMYGER